MLYRALTPLDNGRRTIAKGEAFRSTELSEKAIAVLEQRGKIAPVAAPPLSALPGWKTRSARLAKAGIESAEQFLEAPIEQLAKLFKATPSRIEAWQAEVAGWLADPNPKPKG